MSILRSKKNLCSFLKLKLPSSIRSIELFNSSSVISKYFPCNAGYCTTTSVPPKNLALAKYVETFNEEFSKHRDGRFQGMRRNVIMRKLEIVNALMNDIDSACSNIKSLEELCVEHCKEDQTFATSVKEELEEQKKVIKDAEDAIILELMPDDDKIHCDEMLLEITAGVGGQEAMLFAQELYEMYSSYITYKNWVSELTDLEKTELGGLRHSSLLITGKDCFKLFRFEGGVHRVQRVPKTEKYGRMQTSTATVAVLPQPSEVDVVINEKDLKIETKTSRGPGGQHVNKIETAVRIHHLPTSIIVDCQVHKSQYQNKKLAMQKLRSKLYEIELEKIGSEVRNLRKIQIGTKSRNEKVRTYNFNQDRITDHRFNLTIHNLERYFQGEELLDDYLHLLFKTYNDQSKKEFINMLLSSYG